MQDFLQFLQAIAGQWVALMSGVVGLLISLYLRIRKRVDIPHAAFWAIGIGCVFIACFLAWLKEHQDLGTARSELSALSKPNLKGLVTNLVPEPMPGRPQESIVLLTVEIRNLGADSIVDDFKFWVTVNGKAVEAQQALMPKVVNFKHSPLKYYRSDMLPMKTSTNPIRRNLKEIGVMYFEVLC